MHTIKLVILLRTLYRYRFNTIIAVFGFSTALACAMILMIKVYYSLSTDRQHEHYDRIYRTVQHIKRGDGLQQVSSANYPMSEVVRAELPQVQATSMVQFGEKILKTSRVDGTPIKWNVAYAENDFFDIFSFAVVAGDRNSLLQEPFTVVLSPNQVFKLYGIPVSQANLAIGKELYIDDQVYLIEGIISNFENPTDYPFDIIASFQTLRSESNMLNAWTTASSDVNCYLLVQEMFDEPLFLSGLEQLKDKYYSPESAATKELLIQPLSDVHFNSSYTNFTYNVESKQSIFAMLAVALALIILAVINYINLSTAQSTSRAKEVGIRQVMGSSRRDLLVQFMSESLLVTAVSLFFSLAIVELCYLNFNDLLAFPNGFSVLQSGAVASLFLVLLVTVTFFSGYYPAIVLSRYQITDVMKSSPSGHSSGGLNLRRSLIALQYITTQVLLIFTLVVTAQLDFFLSRPLGFNQEAKVTFPIPGNDILTLQSLRQKLKSDAMIDNVTFGLGAPHTGSMFTTHFGIGLEPESPDNLAEVCLADPNFPEVFNLDLLAGKLLVSDTSNKILINERMMFMQGFDSPEAAVGKSFGIFGERLIVAGVIKDFHMQSLRSEVKPLVISTWNEHYYEGIVSLNLGNDYSFSDLNEAISRVEAAWMSTFPGGYFEATVFDDVIRQAYQTEINTSRALNLFSIVAIVISSLGLFGLITFMIMQRTKEIGIRKVLGANAFDISYILSREFLVLMLAGSMIAIPIGFHISQQWLDQFAFRIPLSSLFAFGALALSLVITIGSIALKLVAASKVNPARLLRME